MKKLGIVSVVLLILTVGCGPRVDLEAEREAIQSADTEWSQTPPDLDRFMSFYTEDAYSIAPDAPVAVGRDAIRSLFSPMFSNAGFSVTWTPTDAEVSQEGQLGYTVGTFELTLEDSAGNPMQRTGKYLTVWRKQADGQWRVAADIISMDSPPAEEEPE